MGKLTFPRSGVHWKRIKKSDPELYSLAREKNSTRNTALSPRSIPVVFGNLRGELILRKVNEQAIFIYRQGYCTMLAMALHRLLGYDLVLFTKGYGENGCWFGHAAVKLPEGGFLDITGIFDDEEAILTGYDFRAPAQVVSSQEFHESVIYGESTFRDIFSYVNKLEELVTYDFAKHLIEVHGLTPSR